MITIALTTICFNAEKTIERCVDSVLHQHDAPDRYIIVDGRSTDATLEIVQKPAYKNTIDHLISESDEGISDAFNKAWRASECDYVATLNADDWVAPDYIAKVRIAIETAQPDIIISHLSFENAHSKRLIKPRVFNSLPPKNWFHPAINHPGMVIRRSLLEKAGGYQLDYAVAMDVDLYLRLLAFSPRVHVIEAPLVHQWDGGVSQSHWHLALSEMRRIEIAHGRTRLGAWLSYLFRTSKKILKLSLPFEVPR